MLAGLGLIGFLWLAVEWNIGRERARDLAAAQMLAENLAKAFELHVTRIVEEIDNTLLLVREQLSKPDVERASFGKLVNQPGVSNRFVSQMLLIDPDGLVRNTRLGPLATALDLSDREHFKVHLDASRDDLFVGQAVIGRSNRAWSVPFTRRAVDQQGQFNGVVVASLDPFQLSSVYSNFDLSGTGKITLVGYDGIIRAHAPDPGGMLGQVLSEPALMEHLARSPAGFYHLADSAGQMRFSAYRAVPNYPLAVIVSKADSEIFQLSDKAASVERALAFLASLAILALGIFAARAKVNFETKRYRFHSTLRHLNQGIMIVEPEGQLSLINQRAIDLLELPQKFAQTPTTYRDVVTYQLDRGEFGSNSELIDKSMFEGMMNMPLSAPSARAERVRPNGTVLEIYTARLPHGGFIRTFTDITQRQPEAAPAGKAPLDRERLAHPV